MPLIGDRKQILPVRDHRRIDVDQALQLAVAVGLIDGGIPGDRAAVADDCLHVPVIEAAHRQLPDEDRTAIAAQRQARHLLINHPGLGAIGAREPLHAAVDTAHDHQVAPDGRGREHLGVHMPPPALFAIGLRQRDHIALGAADDDQALAAPGPPESGALTFSRPQPPPAGHIEGLDTPE